MANDGIRGWRRGSARALAPPADRLGPGAQHGGLVRAADPRCAWKVEHRRLDVLVFAVCAVLGNAETFEGIAPYERCKEAWLTVTAGRGPDRPRG